MAAAPAVEAPAVEAPAVEAPAVEAPAVEAWKDEPQRPCGTSGDALTPTQLAYETNTLIGQFRLCHPLCCSWHDDASAR